MENNDFNLFKNIRSAVDAQTKTRNIHLENEKKQQKLLDKNIKKECSELYQLFLNIIQTDVILDIKEHNNSSKFQNVYYKDINKEFPNLKDKFAFRLYNNDLWYYYDSVDLDKHCLEFNKYNMKLFEFRSGLNILSPQLFISYKHEPIYHHEHKLQFYVMIP